MSDLQWHSHGGVSELQWHYGPTATDPDPGKMWCDDCGCEVWYIKADGETVAICSGCHRMEHNGS